MPRRLVRTAFAVPRPQTPSQWTGLLDMARYDQCTVSTFSHDLVVFVSPPDRHPTHARWASFGLHVLASVPLDASGIVPTSLTVEARAKLTPPRFSAI